MEAISFIVVFSVLATAFAIATARFPEWAIASLHRDRLWQLRDRIHDLVIAGDLPATQPAVRELMRQSDLAARFGAQPSMQESPEGLSENDAEVLVHLQGSLFDLAKKYRSSRTWSALMARAFESYPAIAGR